MKKKFKLLIISSLVLALIGCAKESNSNTDKKSVDKETEIRSKNYAWVLVDTINYDGAEDIEHTNEGGIYEAKGNVSSGNYSYSFKYLGESDDYYTPPVINGEGATINCNFTAPPKTIKADETISLKLSMEITNNSLSYYTAAAKASADIEDPTMLPGFTSGNEIVFVNDEEKEAFTVDTYKTVNILSINENITAKAPKGEKEGDQIAIRTLFYPGAKMGTSYVYEWKSIK